MQRQARLRHLRHAAAGRRAGPAALSSPLAPGSAPALGPVSPPPHRRMQGLIMEGTGFARFNIKYGCIVFRPFKNEVMDALVTAVNNVSTSNSTSPCSPLSRSTPK